MRRGRWREIPGAGGATAASSSTPSSRSNGPTNLECPGSPNLNLSNRPVRTRMPGGVAGARSNTIAPYADYEIKSRCHGGCPVLRLDQWARAAENSLIVDR